MVGGPACIVPEKIDGGPHNDKALCSSANPITIQLKAIYYLSSTSMNPQAVGGAAH